MTRRSILEYAQALRSRYFGVSREEKGKMLDEFTQVTGRHRKAAIRLFRGGNQPRASRKRGCQRLTSLQKTNEWGKTSPA